MELPMDRMVKREILRGDFAEKAVAHSAHILRSHLSFLLGRTIDA